MMRLEESVTILLVTLILICGSLAARAGRYLIAMERGNTAPGAAGDGFAAPE
jgi:hypothetical protein